MQIEITINPEWDETRVRFAEWLVENLQNLLEDDATMLISSRRDNIKNGIDMTCAVMGSGSDCIDMLLAAMYDNDPVRDLIMHTGKEYMQIGMAKKMSQQLLKGIGIDNIKAMVGEEMFERLFPNAEEDQRAAEKAAKAASEKSPFSNN